MVSQSLESLTVEQLFQEADRLIQSSFPGVAKTSRPSRKRKPTNSDRTSTSSSSRSTGSSRISKPNYSGVSNDDRKLNSRGDAQAWGRLGASLGTGINNIDEMVESEFHGFAIASYEKRMTQLHGAPF